MWSSNLDVYPQNFPKLLASSIVVLYMAQVCNEGKGRVGRIYPMAYATDICRYPQALMPRI